MPLNADVVELSQIPTHGFLTELLAKVQRKHFMVYDGQRISFAFTKAKAGDACLEVGPGRGDLTRLLVREKLFNKVSVIDIEDRSHLNKIAEFRMMSVAAMDFPDRAFDMVYCMEVLEHLSDADLAAALSGLRRVCRGHLLITVPYLEPMPSKYHLQQFTEVRVRELFPNGRFSLLLKEPVTRVPWLLIEEDHTKK